MRVLTCILTLMFRLQRYDFVVVFIFFPLPIPTDVQCVLVLGVIV